MLIFIPYSDQVIVFLYLIVLFSTLWRGGRANFSYFGETRPNTHGDTKVHRFVQESQGNLNRN